MQLIKLLIRYLLLSLLILSDITGSKFDVLLLLSIFLNWQDLNIFYQMATGSTPVSKSLVVILLHGASSSSQVWNDLRTMHLIAAMGHRAIAVDLPGTFHYKL